MHQASCFIGLHDFNFIKRLKDTNKWKEFGKEEQQFLLAIQEEITNLDYSHAKDYDDQISLIDQFLWKKLFQEDIRDNVPDLYYLAQENIMRELLPSILIEDNIVSQALFNSNFRQIILDNFEGIIGCWDKKNDKGTHFFWYKDENNEAKRLFLEGKFLISQDKSKKIRLDRKEILSLIEKKEIIPNLFVIFGYMV